MKILKRGDIWRQITCPRCQSHLEIEDHDILVTSSIRTLGTLDAVVGCPVCRHMLTPEVPDYLKTEIHQKDQQRADLNFPD